jgi:hypothetical protein
MSNNNSSNEANTETDKESDLELGAAEAPVAVTSQDYAQATSISYNLTYTAIS